MQTRGFIHITYKLYFHLNRLSGQKKSNCLNVFMALMKHCWKKNNYSAGLRHMTLAKDTNLSRSTIKRSLDTLEKMNVVYSIKGRSGKTYSINQLFIKNEGLFQGSSNLHTSMSKFEPPNAQIRATLVDTLEVYTIENIIRDNRGNQQAIVDNLAKLPLAQLNSDKELQKTKYGVLINWPGASVNDNNSQLVNKEPEIEFYQLKNKTVSLLEVDEV